MNARRQEHLRTFAMSGPTTFDVIAAISNLVLGATPFPASICDLVGVYATSAAAGELVRTVTSAVPAQLRNLLPQPSCRGDVLVALRQACLRGDLRLAQWLASRFDLTAADARADDNAALHFACLNGRLAAAQWLVSHFGLTAADARASDNYALRHACEGGHLVMAQWLVARFSLTAADARADDNFALRS